MNLLQRPLPPLPERLVEYVLFTGRWLLAPIHPIFCRSRQ